MELIVFVSFVIFIHLTSFTFGYFTKDKDLIASLFTSLFIILLFLFIAIIVINSMRV